MSSEIARIACSFSESEAELNLFKNQYEVALKARAAVAERLSAALIEEGFNESIAIALDDYDAVFCDYDGEDGYLFNLIRVFS